METISEPGNIPLNCLIEIILNGRYLVSSDRTYSLITIVGIFPDLILYSVSGWASVGKFVLAGLVSVGD